ncbi:DUF3500 domain-containing protein [Microbulbifer sp. 2205BS26-8]|nr:DUF3500 domain-containing protein [Microbulbifer sp. 2205BS26-8]MDP5208541.1 DUF3500 domain-containing protein [Microbulbifer sp. 2205BS26-8]
MPHPEWPKLKVKSTRHILPGLVKTPAPPYMRIQGPTLIIELLSIGGNVGENASGKGHYHSIYRNPSMEYGV